MKPNDIFSIKDFFNYYIAGFLWLIDTILLALLFFGNQNFQNNLKNFNSFASQFSSAIGAIILIVVPYLFGFIFNPLSTKLAEKIRERWNEAILWVTATDPKHRFAKQRLKEWEKESIKAKMKDLYNLQDKEFSDLFFTIRAYVDEHSQGANALATRALDLTNFAESILIPLPLLFVITGILLVMNSPWPLLFIAVGVGIFFLVLNRYLALRSYWVKHVYRAFLSITAKNN